MQSWALYLITHKDGKSVFYKTNQQCVKYYVKIRTNLLGVTEADVQVKTTSKAKFTEHQNNHLCECFS